MIRVLAVGLDISRSKTVLALKGQPDLALVGVEQTVPEALKRVKECDLVLASVDLPENGTCELTRTLLGLEPCVRVLVVGKEDAPLNVLRYLEAGAIGFISEQKKPEAIAAEIRTAYRGQANLSPEMAVVVLERLAELASWFDELGIQAGKTAALTRREREVLHLIGRDFTNQDIANHLIIEVGTVKNHVHNILAKLEVSSRREAASYVALFKEKPRRSFFPVHASPVERFLA